MIDLTHLLDVTIPTWSGSKGFSSELKLDYAQCKAPASFRVQQLKMHAGIGTHMDAPSHCIPGGISIHELPIEHFCGNGICLNVAEESQNNEEFLLLPKHIHAFEEKYGLIPVQSLVIIYTGWSKRWPDPKAYVNNYRFPSVSYEAALLLLEREICGLAVDTLSPDLPSQGHPVHKLLLSHNRYIIENVASAHLLPPTGFTFTALPIKGKDLTEAPIRLIAKK